MTISAYRVDNLIKAYNKQIRPNQGSSATHGFRGEEPRSELISKTPDVDKENSYQKISESLLNNILKDRT